MSHLVVGAGLIGASLAERLVARGDRVSVATRSGASVVGAKPVVLDARDPVALIAAADGADTIFLCASPPYPKWVSEWPPIYEAVIAAATATGASLVMVGNLYAYGPPSGPMNEHSPQVTQERKGLVRRAGWELALAAHGRGDTRVTEVRPSDYFGPNAQASTHLGAGFFLPVLASKTARVVGNPALAHSWSYLPDIVTTMIAASEYSGEWGRAWHVPSNDPVARTEIVRQINARWGTRGSVAGIPQWLLGSLGAFNPMMREIFASSYQFRMPFVIDSAETEQRLGISATPWDDALARTIEYYLRSAVA